jgi:hypothetical protein
MLAQVQIESMIESMIDKLGFPVVVIIALALASWRAAKWWAPIIKDWGERFIGSHEKLVNSAVSIGESNTETLRSTTDTLKGQAITIAKIENTLEALRNTQLEMHTQNQQNQRP